MQGHRVHRSIHVDDGGIGSSEGSHRDMMELEGGVDVDFTPLTLQDVDNSGSANTTTAKSEVKRIPSAEEFY